MTQKEYRESLYSDRELLQEIIIMQERIEKLLQQIPTIENLRGIQGFASTPEKARS